MIRQLHINNYKSLSDLTLEVGRFNVLIGENGCGKSNVLEAIALAAAATANKLDNEFLASRGIRVTEPQLMRAAFSDENLTDPIQIIIGLDNLDKVKYTLTNDNQPYAKWTRLVDRNYRNLFEVAMELANKEIEENKSFLPQKIDQDVIEKTFRLVAETYAATSDPTRMKTIFLAAKDIFLVASNYLKPHEIAENYLDFYKDIFSNEEKLKAFLIYSPENSALRNFSKEGQIEPLGINGEGLLKLLIVIQSKSPEQFAEIHTCLQLFDWYDGIEIPKDLSHYEDKVTITDRFLSSAFDQRSANEGFLFVLFYIALMVSDDTPKIFAIDNIDVALNPKLCTKLIKELVRLAKKYDKQVFVTTHNPAILDGIDLGDDEQRLLVLSRNKQGHTRFKRITLQDKPRSSTHEELKLSEAFLRGYLGGLPKGF